MDVPNVRRNEYQLVSLIPILHAPRFHLSFCSTLPSPQVNIDDGFLNLMNSDGVTKDDVKVPEDTLGAEIQSSFDQGKELLVTIIAAMGEEQVSLPSPLLLVIILTSLRLSPSRRPLRAPTSLIFCTSSHTMRHALSTHLPARLFSLSSLLFISVWYCFTRPPLVRYPLFPPFPRPRCCCNYKIYSCAHFECTQEGT
jgi:Eukaryotic elongation factor 5A hypusine, DNA-binding OB fold